MPPPFWVGALDRQQAQWDNWPAPLAPPPLGGGGGGGRGGGGGGGKPGRDALSVTCGDSSPGGRAKGVALKSNTQAGTAFAAPAFFAAYGSKTTDC